MVTMFDTSGPGPMSRTSELELASRVLQAVSAVYLIFKSSRAPQIGELILTLQQVRGWLDEFEDGVRRGPARGSDLVPLSRTLAAALNALESMMKPPSPYTPGGGDSVSRHIKSAAALMRRADGYADINNHFLAGCCAADLQTISQFRSQS